MVYDGNITDVHIVVLSTEWSAEAFPISEVCLGSKPSWLNYWFNYLFFSWILWVRSAIVTCSCSPDSFVVFFFWESTVLGTNTVDLWERNWDSCKPAKAKWIVPCVFWHALFCGIIWSISAVTPMGCFPEHFNNVPYAIIYFSEPVC